ncbi:MAG TPA: hypothetical protein VGV37_10970 [Aliidongia sp.]|uniref:hypothetical protein n=1 Tax=Aliidongia sp. TaxID=1914230 RepID=UPI002DDD42B6|nr:hypothetical protein [Aliidongia sp.]HEV2675052.1 hypothetical protein [Aliidongia sp.]
MLLLLLFPASAGAAERLDVVYPVLDGRDVTRQLQFSLLRLALEKSGQPYVIRPYDSSSMTNARMQEFLADGQPLTVAWFGTSADAERRFLPVRIPLTRGLIGVRLLLIAKDRQADFDRVRRLNDLSSLLAGQGFGWADIEILRHSGLQVSVAPMENLFGLTALKRIDYFPLGANEIYDLLEQHRDVDGLAVEQDLALHFFHFDMFFFVNRANEALGQALQQGLERAYADGSFMTTFNAHPDIVALRHVANLEHRRWLEVPNPLLSAETSALPARYWEEPSHGANVD